VSKKYWCQECNRETHSKEELVSAGGFFRDGEPYYSKRHKIDIYGEEQLVEEFAMLLGAPSLNYATPR